MRRRFLFLLPAILLGGCLPGGLTGPSAAEIVTRAGDSLNTSQSFHFSYKNEGGGAPIFNNLTLNTADGDFAKPDKLRVKINANYGSSVVESEFIALGEQGYISNPLTREWQKVPGAVSAGTVFDPQTGVTAILKKMKNPTRQADETIDGVATYHIQGEVDAGDLSSYTGGKPLTGTALKTDIWVGQQDFRIRQVRIPGKIAEEDPAGIIRTIKLSAYDQPVTIQAPPGVS